MSDNRQVAGIVLKEAWETIAKKRPGVHGSAELSFEMIGDFWTIYLRHARRTRGNDTIRPEDVAEMMAMLKKARKMYGDPNNIDNDVDDLGYTGLAAMLRLPDITKNKEDAADAELDKLDPQVAVAEQVDLLEAIEKKEVHTHEWMPDGDYDRCIQPGCKAKRKREAKANV